MQYQPTWESIKSHPRPQWFDDAKLGIFIHWGLYSVPAWANTNWELGAAQPTPYEWFAHNSYAEWYLNTIRIKESEAWAYHKRTYGEDFPYEKFAEMFTCNNWNPAQWADIFKDAGAEYVVLTAKHHDGFCLYPSDYTDYNSVKQGPKRDLTGELTQAVRDAGLKMGLYFSGLLDWTFDLDPIVDHIYQQKYALKPEHVAISRNQTMELIDKYKPSILWGDIGWPIKGENDLPEILSHYYNMVPEGLVNDRWNGLWQDYYTAEYLTGVRDLALKWEMCRGLGLSFGYNQNEDESTMLTSRQLVELLCEYVSANGNLLINVGPKADGTIPEKQISLLRDLGAWLKKHGEAIYGTRPYMPCQSEVLSGGTKVYYTQKSGTVFAILCGFNKGKHTVKLPALDKVVSVEISDEMPVHVPIVVMPENHPKASVFLVQSRVSTS